jgi:hypothetical protein
MDQLEMMERALDWMYEEQRAPVEYVVTCRGEYVGTYEDEDSACSAAFDCAAEVEVDDSLEWIADNIVITER